MTTTTTATPSSEASTTTNLEPETNYPGKCVQKDNIPVDLSESWEASCKDNEGKFDYKH